MLHKEILCLVCILLWRLEEAIANKKFQRLRNFDESGKTKYQALFGSGTWLSCGHDIDEPEHFMTYATNSTLHQISLNKSVTAYEPSGPCSTTRDCSTDKGMYHQFTHYYASFFEKYREVYTEIAEVGVEWGGSVRMWMEYFPKAIVHGIDIKEKAEIPCVIRPAS